MQYQVVEAQSFWDCVDAMRQDDQHLGALMNVLAELRKKPFQSSKLKTHGVGTASNGKKVFASDVGGRAVDRRIVWQLFNNTILVLLYGTHKIYDRVKRMRVDFDPATRAYTVFEQAPDSGQEQSYQHQREVIGKLFMAWTDTELRAFDFPDTVVANLRQIDSDAELLAMESDLGDRYFEMAFNLIAHRHPDGEGAAAALLEVEEDPTPPPATAEDLEVERQLQEENMPAWFTRTEPEFLEEVMGRPIEDWMIFLHPDQRSVVRRSYQGPARVRGSAGTGKTVVGLHRAVWLAKRNQTLRWEQESQLAGTSQEVRPILFTTYISSLPPVLEALYLRMPGARSGEVEFKNVHKLAHWLCSRNGERPTLNQKEVSEAFTAAYERVIVKGTPLGDKGLSRKYLQDEVVAVVKGRALETLDEYLAVARTGRKAPLGRRQRAQVWELREAWDEEMAKRGVVDFPDVILKALHHARRLDEPLYSAVIIDEAQDLTLAGLLFLRALVNAPHPKRDRPNGLLILGDGAQRIYPGGYTLRQAGVEVRGRTTLLNVNYRNTSGIIDAAMAVAGGSDVEDLGEDYRRGDQLAETARTGPMPILVRASDPDDQIDRIAEMIEEMAALEDPIEPGDVAVLALWRNRVGKIEKLLKAQGCRVQKLDNYDGRPNDRIKIGTYHRAKGLEFKAVFLPYLNLGWFPTRPNKAMSPEEAEEARQLEVSALFVAMTRARDVLVLLHNGEPSNAIAPAIDHFKRLSQAR